VLTLIADSPRTMEVCIKGH